MKLTKKWECLGAISGHRAMCGPVRLDCFRNPHWGPGWRTRAILCHNGYHSFRRQGKSSEFLEQAKLNAERVASELLKDMRSVVNQWCADCGIDPVED